jgi:RNA 2',3'-cyclic 3'-phosphodiesterase
MAAFDIELKGLGVFKKISDPRVVFAGLSSNEPLLQLRKNLVDKLRDIKLYDDERPFSPHITLCRVRSIKNTENLRNFIAGKANYMVMKQQIVHFSLYESVLRPAGPVYKELVKVPFIK